MAEFIAKLGLDAKDFISSMEQAASKAGSITTALNSSAGSSKTLADGFKSANTEATNLDKNVKSIEGNLSKAASGGGALDGLTAKFKEGQSAAASGGGIFGDLAGKLGQLATPAGAATAAVAALGGALAAAYTIGSEFQQNLAGVSAVTGLTGPALDDIGDRARNLAKQFGGDASTQLQAFQGVLSKFGASLADTPEQLGKVSENINILAKAGGLDAKEAMDTLANSMLQFGVDVADGNVAAAESARFMNVLAASAKVGAAEIPQVGQAVLVAGVAAKGAKVSFEETNAAIQVLAAGGKVGAEAGTALRNVLGKIAGEEVIPKPALDKLKSLGVDMSVVSNTSLSLSDRLKELGKASSDATAFAQVFGSENAAAATILANGSATIQDWTKQITGTSEANTQAATNMDTLSERVSRAKASVSDFAIGLFQTLEPAFSAIIGGIMDFVGIVTDGIGGLWSFVEPLVMPIFEFFNARLVFAFNVIKSVITGFVEAGQEAFERFQEVIAPLQEKFKSLFQSAESGTSIMDSLKVVFQVITDVVKNVFLVAFGLVLKVVEGIVFAIGKLIDVISAAVNWVKDIARAFTDWGTNLVKSNDLIRVIVDSITAFVTKAIQLKDELLSLLGLGGQEVKVQAKVESKTEEQKTTTETVVKKEQPTAPKEKADPAAAEKASKALLDLKKGELETAIAILKTESQQRTQAIEQKALAEGRMLTDVEKIAILKEEAALTDLIKQKTREIYQVTGEGTDIKIGLKLTPGAKQDLTKTVLDETRKLSDQKVDIGFKILKFDEDTRKEFAKQTASLIKNAIDLEKDKFTVEFFTKVDPETGLKEMNAAIAAVREKIAQAESLGFTAIAQDMTQKADELEKKLTELRTKGLAEREKAEKEQAKRNLEIKLEAIENEGARELAKQIIDLEEKRKAILRSTDGTEADRLKIAERYAKQIRELQTGVSDDVAKQRERLRIEEADLLVSLRKKKISYEDYSKEIQRIQSDRTALDKQVDDNKKAVEQIKDNVEDLTSIQPKVVVDLSMDGLEKFGIATGLLISKAFSDGKKYEDIWTDVLGNVNQAATDTFASVSDKALQGLDFKNNGIVDNVTQLAEALGATLVSAEAAGKNLDQSLKQSFSAINTGISSQLKVLTADFDKQFTEAAQKGEVSFEALGSGAATLFGGLIAQGANATSSLKSTLAQTLGQLLQVYIAPIIASTLSFLGPFAIPIATAAIATLKGLLNSALAGFQDGGYTGDRGEGAVAGVVHGQEFVHTASVTRKNRALFEYLHKGGELSNWAVSAAGNLQQPVSIAAPMVNTYGIESRLDRLETAIVKSSKRFDSMRAVQMTVEHDPTLTIKAQSRNLQVRNARV